MDEDPLQRQIYFITFIESLEVIFPQYKETCEVLLDYLKIVEVDINYYIKRLLIIFCIIILISIVEG